MLVVAQLIVGFVLLIVGGELLVRGAASLASAFNISPLVIGLTVVAFGTSAPELGVSLQAAFSGAADVSVGNVVGSNIINVLLILGVAAIVSPLIVASQLIRFDVPIMLAASVAFWAMSSDGELVRWEGAVLFTALLVYIFYCIRKSRSENEPVVHEFEEYAKSIVTKKDIVFSLGLFVVGLVMLAIGSNLLVKAAVFAARYFGVSELVIGLTIVAIGTSLPEVVTSVVASYRGQRDIAVGNVVGSNLFNLLCVIGLTAFVAPAGLSVSQTAVEFDIPIMVAVALICIPFFWTGHLIQRWEGAVFLILYVIYNGMVVLAAQKSSLANHFNGFLLYVMLPVTLFLVVISIWQSKTVSKRSS